MGVNLQVTERISITGIRKSDLPSMSQYLNDPLIHANTLSVPYPYGLKDAQTFFGHTSDFQQAQGFPKDYAIRLKGTMCGGIGLMFNFGIASHKSEFGYWLARDFWNQGIMSAVVPAFVAYAFESTNLIRIEAHVFEGNDASCRVLEKAGFKKEGYLRKAFEKIGVFKDATLYAILA